MFRCRGINFKSYYLSKQLQQKTQTEWKLLGLLLHLNNQGLVILSQDLSKNYLMGVDELLFAFI